MSENLRAIAEFAGAVSVLTIWVGAAIAYIRDSTVRGSIQGRLIAVGFLAGALSGAIRLASLLA